MCFLSRHYIHHQVAYSCLTQTGTGKGRHVQADRHKQTGTGTSSQEQADTARHILGSGNIIHVMKLYLALGPRMRQALAVRKADRQAGAGRQAQADR